MASVLSILLSIAIGCLLVYRFSGFSGFAPRWAAWMLLVGCGIATGIGLNSCLFFFVHLGLPGVTWPYLILRLGAKRFGAPAAATETAVRAITDHDRLQRMADRVLDATNWGEVLATP